MNGKPTTITAAVLAATLCATAPAGAATIDVLGWTSSPLGFTPCAGSCVISVPFGGNSNLAEPTPAGYQGVGFRPGMIYNDATGNPAGSVFAFADSLPAHSSLNISFLLAVIDSWDGNTSRGGTVPPDIFNITVGGVSVFSHTFDNFDLTDQSAPTTNLLSSGTNLGFNGGAPDSAYDFTGVNALLNIPHTADSFEIRFFASGAGWQGGDDESFGLDRLMISVNTNNVPEPGSLALLGLGFAGLALRRRFLR